MGYHLRGYSRMRYLLKIVRGVWNQKSKRVDRNHNPIVLLEGLVWNTTTKITYNNISFNGALKKRQHLVEILT